MPDPETPDGSERISDDVEESLRQIERYNQELAQQLREIRKQIQNENCPCPKKV